jgi:hypothetical protein
VLRHGVRRVGEIVRSVSDGVRISTRDSPPRLSFGVTKTVPVDIVLILSHRCRRKIVFFAAAVTTTCYTQMHTKDLPPFA